MMLLPGLPTISTAVIRTFVSVVVPTFSTRKVSDACSQLSR